MKRRKFICLLGLFPASAGCLAGSGRTDNSDPNPDPNDCEIDGYELWIDRIDSDETISFSEARSDIPVHYDETDNLRLTASPERVEHGDDITFRLENISDEEVKTSNYIYYTIQAKSSEGWVHPYWLPEGMDPWYGPGSDSLEPGEGYTWDFEATADSFLFSWEYEICMDPFAGPFRFVYFGLDNEKTAIATKFEIVKK